MPAHSLFESIKRVVGLLAFTVYAIYFGIITLLVIGCTFHPSIPHPWAIVASFALRTIPIVIYFRLRHNPVRISNTHRATALGIGVLSISLSYLMIGLSVADSLPAGVPHFWHDYLECTPDIWPCGVMLLFVKNKVREKETETAKAPI